MKGDRTWDRLAKACLDARDDCRRIHQLASAGDPAAIEKVKELAAINADRLRIALKHPMGNEGKDLCKTK